MIKLPKAPTNARDVRFRGKDGLARTVRRVRDPQGGFRYEIWTPAHHPFTWSWVKTWREVQKIMHKEQPVNMALTRKDFIILADQLKAGHPPTDSAQTPGYVRAIGTLSEALSKINPAFDKERFIQACMPESE